MKAFLKNLLIIMLTALLVSAQQKRETVDLDSIAEQARALASKPYQPPTSELPEDLKSLSYDDYRNIRYRPSEALWWDSELPFHVEFFHPGHIHSDLVKIYEATDTHIQKIPFLRQAFKYDKGKYNPSFLSEPDGYAGIRVKYPLNNPEVFDDLIVFQGASYFRALGKNQAYGLSLRGLSMNTLGNSEDFPVFTNIWLQKPLPGSNELTIFALLEGKKVAGAYSFKLIPNGRTRIDVKAKLYFRDGGQNEVGIAPITSMFTFGENTEKRPGDWRPEVHDSDGLLIHSDAEWTWHALENLPGRNTQYFPAAKMYGFGLFQRDRQFANYKDLEAQYERRPSAWIEPSRRWKNGSVVLYTFHTPNETVDNVVAFWKPDQLPGGNTPTEIEYSIFLQLTEPEHNLARVLETRIGERTLDSTKKTVVIEFTRPPEISENEISLLSIDFRSGAAKLTEEPVIQYSAPEDRIRVFANIQPPAENQGKIELSGRLLKDGHIISERWSYSWSP